MIEFTRCHVEHIRYIVAQDAQADDAQEALAVYGADIAGSSVAISAWASGRCLGAAGLIDVWGNRAFAWALLSKYAKPHMLAITRHIRFVLDNHPTRRVEMAVKAEFKAGHQWAKMLGFQCETPNGMRAYLPDGSDAMLYARVKC